MSLYREFSNDSKLPPSMEFINIEESAEAIAIQCPEKSKGGIKYEVILPEPAPKKIISPKRLVTPGKDTISASEIEEKLKAAEERRISLEAKKMAELSAKIAKIEEVCRRKEELNNEFILHTKEVLENKLEKYEENRESIITDLKEKLKIQSTDVEQQECKESEQSKA